MRELTLCLSLAATMSIAGCGGGGAAGPGDGGSNPGTSAAANVQPVTVEVGPGGNRINMLFTSVTLCVPGSSTQCKTIDHIQVDTGSSGLRVMASEIPAAMVLPRRTDGGGNTIVECAQFADGFAWGPVKFADVRIAGEEAASVPIQVIGDPGFAVIPNDCVNTGAAENTADTFGANGLLGVGVLKQDCGSVCAQSAGNGYYYACPGSGCQPNAHSIAQSLDQQVPNPVPLFANDNNGVIIELPAVSAAGAASVSGSLVFGIDTQTNNAIGAAQVFRTTADTGTLTTNYNNQVFNLSLLDSGSSALFFADSQIPACGQQDPYAPGFYCPASAQDLRATLQGENGVSAILDFSLANARALFSANPGYWAFSNVGVPVSGSFIWGLPVFFGRNVFAAVEGQNTAAGPGPFMAF